MGDFQIGCIYLKASLPQTYSEQRPPIGLGVNYNYEFKQIHKKRVDK